MKLTFVEENSKKIFLVFPEDSDEEGLLMSGHFRWCPGKLQGHDSDKCAACVTRTRGYFATNERVAIQFIKYADEQASRALSVNPDLKILGEWYAQYPPPVGWRARVYENMKPED
jgi:hypothetical protein